MLFPFTYFQNAPNFSVWHSHPGKKSQVLVTAGVDGDEYQAIDLAKQLIATYNLSTPITVIPIVNLAGYHQKTSYNPLDRHYPKHIFPGSPIGSSSSKLMYQISKLTHNQSYWIDLHCAATGETLYPFVWAPEPYPILSHLKTRTLVEPSVNKGVPYLMFEHGSLDWILSVIKNLHKPALTNWQPTYTKIKYEKYNNQTPRDNTLWYSSKNLWYGTN